MPAFHQDRKDSGRSRSRTALPVLAYIMAFAFTAWLAGVILPPPEMPTTVREKLTYFADHSGEYDAVFVGSSRIENHIMPSLFDRLVSTDGRPMKSFNAGVASLRTPEDGWVLDHILARKSPRLRWVFLEIDFFKTELQEDQKGTLRGVYWHDWPRFLQLCRRHLVMRDGFNLRDQIADFFERLHDFLDHLSAFGQYCTQLGRGALLFDRWRHANGPEPMDWKKLGENGDGWRPTRHTEPQDGKSAARLAGLIGERTGTVPKPKKADRVSQAVLGEEIAKIIRAGAVPVLVIPPRTRVSYFTPSAENARRVAVINLCDPVKYPELYEARNRIDTSHLNAAGAEVFTRIVAARFLEIASGKSAPLSPLPPAAR